MATKAIPIWGRDKTAPRTWALVDEDDYALAMHYRWHQTKAGYAASCLPGRLSLYLHRLICDLHPKDGLSVDHINHDPLDNRRANLRVVTHAQNMQNQRARRTARSGARGVTWDRRAGKWVARGRLNYQAVHLGSFERVEDAANAAAAWRARVMPFATN